MTFYNIIPDSLQASHRNESKIAREDLARIFMINEKPSYALQAKGRWFEPVIPHNPKTGHECDRF